MEKATRLIIIWSILLIVFAWLGAYGLTNIQKNNLDSQIFELERFQSCKLLHLESIITNSSTNDSIMADFCASGALLKADYENRKYLDNQEKLWFYNVLSIISSLILIILSIYNPLEIIKRFSPNKKPRDKETSWLF